MTCLEVQGLITRFINNELNISQLEEFLNHLHHCKDCREDVEVYYVLLTGMKQLDEDRNLSSDFHQDFENFIQNAEDRVMYAKLNCIRKRMLLIFLVFIISVVSGISVKETVEDKIFRSNVNISVYKIPNDFYGSLESETDRFVSEYYRTLTENRKLKEKTKKKNKKKSKKVSEKKKKKENKE